MPSLLSNPILVNGVRILVLAFLSLEYFVLFGERMPERYALTINIMLVPLVFGIAGFFLLKGRLPVKLALMALLPLALVFYFGGDPAKPGLENLVAATLYVFLCLGVVMGAVAKRYLAR